MAVDYGEDFLQRIVGVHWRKRQPAGIVVQQGLLAVYDNDNGSIARGSLHAIALDSGQTFSGVNMGASGMGYTVLTGGLVCFGQPKDGEPCFMACPSFDPAGGGHEAAIMRGTKSDIIGTEDDHSVEIKWETVTSGPVIALTFAGEAFFAVFADASGGPTMIATSFDGVHFSSSQAFPDDPDKYPIGGAVAGLVDENKTSRYVSCGSIDLESPDDPYYGLHTNLAWATSSGGSDWGYDFNGSLLDNPGSVLGQTASLHQHSTVAGGNGVFVAAASDKKVILNIDLPYITHTAAAASSSSGSGWSTTILPGSVPASKSTYSFSACVTFVQTGLDPKTNQPVGYFLCGCYGYTDDVVTFAPKGGVWKSVDGQGWGQIVDNQLFNWTLSAVAKDLKATKIAHV